MIKDYIPHVRLDRCLGFLARRPESFKARAQRLSAALDRRGWNLEITPAERWRGGSRASRVSAERQLHVEVRRLRALNDEEERRLVLRLEFAALRLEAALRQHGLALPLRDDALDCPAVLRRHREWSCLRLEMVERNLHLVLVQLERYRRARTDRGDLFQEGATGLFAAVDRFDWRRGVLFRTYAGYWLRLGFRRHVATALHAVRVPSYLRPCLRQQEKELDATGATASRLAPKAGEPRKRTLELARQAALPARSLDEMWQGPQVEALGSWSQAAIAPAQDRDLDRASLESGIGLALGKLRGRERNALQLRFGIAQEREHSYAEIAAVLDVDVEQVRQILVRALTKLRRPPLRHRLEQLVS